MAAASLRADGTDVPMMLKILADQLGDVLGKRLVVKRAGGRFRKSDEITSVQISLGNDDLRAEIAGPTVRCTVGHSSGGIRIRSAEVSMDEWIGHLVRGLETEAANSERVRLTLERLMIEGSQ